MSPPQRRLAKLVSHLSPFSPKQPDRKRNIHTLSPTHFLPRAAAIEPDVCMAAPHPGRSAGTSADLLVNRPRQSIMKPQMGGHCNEHIRKRQIAREGLRIT